MSTSKQIDPLKPQEPGKRVGPTTEFTLFFTIKPGTDMEKFREGLRQYKAAIDAEAAKPGGGRVIQAGLHESRTVIFDNEKRVVFGSSFDGPWDTYVDDAIKFFAPAFHFWWVYCEGYPGAQGAPIPDRAALREFVIKSQVPAFVYTRTYPRTLKEILKALRVNDAFQKVLDNPAAHKALQDPALQPLLEQASD